jgi:hypothetical protein
MCKIEIEINPTEKLDETRITDKDVCNLIMICLLFSLEQVNYGRRKIF